MKIFYSWQSDTDLQINQRPIRQELGTACIQLEKKYSGVLFEPDEATRDMPGSPNIMQAIFEKIAGSDIFVCDITPVQRLESGKALANPNVLIELGFAVALLGWERIVLLVNEHCDAEVPKDLPFDVEKHRATPFRIACPGDKNGRAILKNVLVKAIEEIYRREPARPADKQIALPEERDRRRDLRALTSLMEIMPIKQIEEAVAVLPNCWHSKLAFYHEAFEYTVGTCEFYLKCSDTAARLNKLREAWALINRYHMYFYCSGTGHSRFEVRPSDSARAEAAYEALRNDRDNLRKQLEDWVSHLHAAFPELDLVETSTAARAFYQETDGLY